MKNIAKLFVLFVFVVAASSGCGVGQIEGQYEPGEDELFGYYPAIQINADNSLEDIQDNLGEICVMECKKELRSWKNRWGVVVVSKKKEPWLFGETKFYECQKTFLYQKGGSQADCSGLFGDLPRCDSWEYVTIQCYLRKGEWEFQEGVYLVNEQTGCQDPYYPGYDIVPMDSEEECLDYQKTFLENFDTQLNKICRKDGVSCRLSDFQVAY